MIDFAEAAARLAAYDREELFEESLRNLGDPDANQRRFLEAHLFWEPAYIAENKVNAWRTLPVKKFNAIDFFLDPEVPPAIYRRGEFSVLPVTTCRVLPLKNFADSDAWFAALSQKNRKKLRWLKNAVPKAGGTICPILNASELEDFYELYCQQFRTDPAHLRDCVGKLMLPWIAEGRGIGRILKDEHGTPLAALLGYLHKRAFFFTHLTKNQHIPEWDKYSPGYFLTWSLIDELLQRKDCPDYFFMGPGDYDYKPAFLGEKSAVCRCERRKLSNVFGLLRMHNRLRKELTSFRKLKTAAHR